MILYNLVVTNKSDDYKLVTGIVYSIGCDTSDELKNPTGFFTLELKEFPKISSSGIGRPFITKYILDIIFDRPNEGFDELFTNSLGFRIEGDYKLNGGTFFNLSPLGMPFGKYINQAVNIGYIGVFGSSDGKVILDIIKKNDTDGYKCLLRID